MSLFFFVQDALFFLKNFFTSLAAEVELFSPPEQEGNNQYAKLTLYGNTGSLVKKMSILHSHHVLITVITTQVVITSFTKNAFHKLEFYGNSNMASTHKWKAK